MHHVCDLRSTGWQGLKARRAIHGRPRSRTMFPGRDDLEAEDSAGVADMADFIDGPDRQVVLADGQRRRDVQRVLAVLRRRWPCR